MGEETEPAPAAENAGAAPPAEGKKKKGKEKKKFDPLSDDPITFKKIDFENALTPEEKAAKKAEKLAAKKGDKKKKKEKPAPDPSAAEAEPAPAEDKKDKKKKEKAAEAEGGDESPSEDKKKGKKDKKKKEGAEGEPAQEAKAGEAAEKKGKKGKKEEAAEGAAPAEKKGKKGKEKGGEEGAEGAETAKKDKKKKEKGEAEAAEAGADKKEKKGKKGKKGEGGEGAEATGEGAEEGKGKKGKGKKDQKEAVEGEEGEDKGEKKKGKKGKDKKQSVELEKVSSSVQASISAFLERYASQQMMNDDEWTWESYSESVKSEKEEEKPKKGKGKGKGKGKKEKAEGGEETEGEPKKGKKGKKEKKETAPPPEPEEEIVSAATDIMAEINKMKAQADAQVAVAATQEEEVSAISEALSKKSKKSKKSKIGEPSEAGTVVEQGPPKEKGPKKKLSKKEKAKLAAEMAEQARIQAELAAKQAEEEERIRLIEERKAAIEKEKRETAEQRLRGEQLNNSLNFIANMRKCNFEKAVVDMKDNQWTQYLKCDGLPNPYVCGEMNTYLHLWEQNIEVTTDTEAKSRTIEVLHLIETLTGFIENPAAATEMQVENWKWLHHLFREYQQRSLDAATYRLLRDIGSNLHAIDLYTADYQLKQKDFALSLWLLVRLPTSMPNPRKPAPPRIEIKFPDMKMKVLFPISIDCQCMAVRGMYVKYNHLSDLCSNYEAPPTPEQYRQNINKVTLEEWLSKLFYKFEEDVKAKKQERIEQGLPAVDKEEIPPVVDRAAGIIPIVPYRKLEPSASGYFVNVEDELYITTQQSLMTTVEENIINLRKYIVVGGTYYINLYYQPPQPQQMVSMDMTITRLEIPKCLSDVPFLVVYQTPPPADPLVRREPEELEEEMKKQEQELDKLILVTVTLPDHIMWLDIPIVCHWDEDKKVWTTEHIHDMKHVEEKGYITFRTARFGCFSFAVNRFQNLPFQAWEMKSELNGSVTFQLTAAILLIEFNIKEDLICVSQFQNTPNNALQQIVGIYYKLPKLIRILRDGGLDFFPEFDAFCYINGGNIKHWPMENHLYYQMAQLSVAFNFQWSRWNASVDRRCIVMQMREYKPDKIRQAPYSMLRVTPLLAEFVVGTEVSPTFNSDPIEGMHFYSDLYHLMKATYGMVTRAKVQSANMSLVAVAADLLIRTRVLSFS